MCPGNQGTPEKLNQILIVFTVKKCCAQKFGQNPFGIFRSEEYLQLALSLTDSLRHTILLDNLQTYKDRPFKLWYT